MYGIPLDGFASNCITHSRGARSDAAPHPPAGQMRIYENKFRVLE